MKRWIRFLSVGHVIAGCLIFVLILLFPIQVQDLRRMRERLAMKQVYQIHQALFAYAQSRDGTFPDGKSSNEAF